VYTIFSGIKVHIIVGIIWQEIFYKRDSNVKAADRPLAISNRILDGTTPNNAVIQKDGVQDKVPGLVNRTFAALDEKQMLVGPLMKPNQLIKRLDDNGDEYFVYFTEETIKKIAYKMMKDKLIDRVNIEHNSSDIVEDAYMVETWLVEDPQTDKANKYGFKPTKGEWFGIYKIDNKKVWDEYIKSGKVKGFSVEGYFSNFAMSKCSISKGKECMCGKSESGLCDGSHLK
jgi:hypothetical protein